MFFPLLLLLQATKALYLAIADLFPAQFFLMIIKGGWNSYFNKQSYGCHNSAITAKISNTFFGYNKHIGIRACHGIRQFDLSIFSVWFPFHAKQDTASATPHCHHLRNEIFLLPKIFCLVNGCMMIPCSVKALQRFFLGWQFSLYLSSFPVMKKINSFFSMPPATSF